MIETIFFDFDGVLTTDGSGSRTVCTILKESARELDLDLMIGCYRKHQPELLRGRKIHADIWDEFCRCIGKELDISLLESAFSGVPVNQPMFEICRTLARTYRLGVITDNSLDRFEILREKVLPNAVFEYLVVSAEVGSLKNEETIFREALQVSKSEPEACVFIDNNADNLIIPEKLGFTTFFHDHEKNDISALIENLASIGVAL